LHGFHGFEFNLCYHLTGRGGVGVRGRDAFLNGHADQAAVSTAVADEFGVGAEILVHIKFGTRRVRIHNGKHC